MRLWRRSAKTSTSRKTLRESTPARSSSIWAGSKWSGSTKNQYFQSWPGASWHGMLFHYALLRPQVGYRLGAVRRRSIGQRTMAQQNTFDVVSKVDMAEVKNAVNQALKEIHQRYDFKDTNSDIQLDEKEHSITLATASEFTLRSLNDVLQQNWSGEASRSRPSHMARS